MITLGLDPSLRAYGWAIHDSSATGMSRKIASGHEGTLSSAVPVARFMHFRAMVRDILKRYPEIQAVGIESPAYSAGPFQTIHFGLMMFSLEAVFERRLDCVLFDPATLKRLSRPDGKKGEMTKLDMQRRVQFDTLDVSVIDNNEADAYMVALHAAKFLCVRNGQVHPSALSANEVAVYIGKTRKIKTLKGVRIKRIAHVFRENNRYFSFSQIPQGDLNKPKKQSINPEILKFLESLESSEE